MWGNDTKSLRERIWRRIAYVTRYSKGGASVEWCLKAPREDLDAYQSALSALVSEENDVKPKPRGNESDED
jgi:hypothetical protein